MHSRASETHHQVQPLKVERSEVNQPTYFEGTQPGRLHCSTEKDKKDTSQSELRL